MSERPRIVVLQHNPRDPLGCLLPPLLEDAELIIIRAYADPRLTREAVEGLIRTAGYDGLIVLGGPMGVYERGDFPFLEDSMRLLSDALDREAPLLAICLGAQMVSDILGSPVYLGAQRGLAAEVGFFPLRVAEGQQDDPVISLYLDDPDLFWHRDTHELPAGATLLASTDAYQVAAFRLRPNAYGLQFHLETSADLLQIWVLESPLLKESGEDGELILKQAYALEAVRRRRSERLVRQFTNWAREWRQS